MKTSPDERQHERGFTLIEIVVTFIVAAFLGSMMIEYLGASLKRGGESVVMVQEGFSLNGVMEKMGADYTREYLNGAYGFDIFKNNIENGNNAVNTPYYGSYDIQTEYILFDSTGIETSDTSGENRILKVSIRSGNQTLTALFRR